MSRARSIPSGGMKQITAGDDRALPLPCAPQAKATAAQKKSKQKSQYPTFSIADSPSCDLSTRVGDFGAQPVLMPETMYCRMGRMGNSSGVANNREIGLTVTDFFDYNNYDASAAGIQQFVSNYFWSVNQNLMDNAPDASGDYSRTFCRVRKLHVWILPRVRTWGAGTEPDAGLNNAQSMFSVNAQVPGTTQQVSALTPLGTGAFATNTQVTNITPSINPKWKKILTADLQKTFQSGVVRPVFSIQDATEQCLFQMSVVDATDGSPYFSGDDDPPLRVRVKLEIDQPIATFQQAKLAVFRNEQFSVPSTAQSGGAYPGTSEQYVQMNISGARDNFR